MEIFCSTQMIIRRNKQNNVQRVKLSEFEDFELKFFLLSGRLFVSVLETV